MVCESQVKISPGAASLFRPGVPFADVCLFLTQLGCITHVASVSHNQWMERESGRVSGAGSTVLGQFMHFTQRMLCWKICWSLYHRYGQPWLGLQSPWPGSCRRGQGLGLGQTIPSLCPAQGWVSAESFPSKSIHIVPFIFSISTLPLPLTKDLAESTYR